MRHLLGIDGLSEQDITSLLDEAERYFGPHDPIATRNVLRGKTVLNVFFESSTRTRTSFELAGKRLGADVINIAASSSSVTKGETLLDTVKNVEAMQSDAIVLRHSASGAPHFIARHTGASIVNAGDGSHEHPTQALLDAFTIRKRLGKLAGLTVVVCGDILHSRVARSNALLLGTFGTEVRLCGPRTMMPREPNVLGPTVRVFDRFDDAIEGADVVMMLRIQNERLGGTMMSTTREYSRTFGLNPRRLRLAKPGALVMHPGPINRGVELDNAVADGTQSVILDQVEAGVAVRCAVLARVLS
ncbi:aspartate carbamoyltransferase catalytic subunit [Pendulispora albinea]|uniref:Aspartate carbamoyltransferase n=1 Tax=Pendulispora albinea TaxID=2741071 RepID=A0ABZ2LNZ0_9BACT